MKQAKKIRTEMIISQWIWTCLVAVVLLFLSDHKLACLLGALVGAVASTFFVFHMYKHLDIALDMPPEQAKKHSVSAALIRAGVMAVCMTVSVVLYKYIHPIGFALAVFGIKVSALLQPYIHGFYKNKKKKGW